METMCAGTLCEDPVNEDSVWGHSQGEAECSRLSQDRSFAVRLRVVPCSSTCAPHVVHASIRSATNAGLAEEAQSLLIMLRKR